MREYGTELCVGNLDVKKREWGKNERQRERGCDTAHDTASEKERVKTTKP